MKKRLITFLERGLVRNLNILIAQEENDFNRMMYKIYLKKLKRQTT